jgi:hypothetical protein
MAHVDESVSQRDFNPFVLLCVWINCICGHTCSNSDSLKWRGETNFFARSGNDAMQNVLLVRCAESHCSLAHDCECCSVVVKANVECIWLGDVLLQCLKNWSLPDQIVDGAFIFKFFVIKLNQVFSIES